MRLMISLLMLLLLATACNPGRVMKNEMPKDAPPDYQRGWQDGCESGLGSSYTNTWYKTFHAYRKDNRMLTNPMYVVGWDDGNRYCRHYSGQWTRWGYFDTPDGSLRDKNVPEQYSFSIPGWTGVNFDSNPGPIINSENKALVGDRTTLDKMMGWTANAGTAAVGGSHGIDSFWGR